MTPETPERERDLTPAHNPGELQEVEAPDDSQDGRFSEEGIRFIAELLKVEASWVGPIPPPASMAAFEQIQPGLADRIVSMAEKEQDHRHRSESSLIRAETRRTLGGLIAGLVIALSFLCGSVFLVYHGFQWPGTILGSGTLGGMVATFVTGRRDRDGEPEEQAPRAERRRERKR